MSKLWLSGKAITDYMCLLSQVINHSVFKHTGISWEWGIVFVEGLLFFLGCEAWKWAKRIFFRRRAKRLGFTPDDMERLAFADFQEVAVDDHRKQ